MSEVTPLFPGQTGLTPGRRAEIVQAQNDPQDAVEPVDVEHMPGAEAPETATAAEQPSVSEGLLAQLMRGEAAASIDDPDELRVPEVPEVLVETAVDASSEPSTGREEPAIAGLRAALEGFSPSDLASMDPGVRADAGLRLVALSEQARLVDDVFGGMEALLREKLPGRLVDRMMADWQAPAPSLPESDLGTEAVAPMDAQRAGSSPPTSSSAAMGGYGGGGGGSSVIDAIVRSPLTFLSAAGSLAVQAMRGSASLANSGLVAGQQLANTVRKNSFDIMGQQVNSLHASIVREAQWLRAHGMDGLVNEMKASGHTLRDAVAGMDRGGPLEKVGLQFKGLMADPEVRQHYEALQYKLGRFGAKMDQYVKGGAALGKDVEADAEKMFDSLENATEGFPTQKPDGSFGLLGDRIREISEKIREALANLFKRLVPGKG